MPPRVLSMLSKAALPALALTFAGLAAPAQAQFFFRYYAEPFAHRYDDSLSPGEIARSLAARGYRPTGRPWRNGEVYVAEAYDDDGRRVRLIVDAYEGLILRRFREARPAAQPAPAPRQRLAARPAPGAGPSVIEGLGPSAPARPAPPVARPEPRRKAAATPKRAPERVAPPAAVAPAAPAPVEPRPAPPPSEASKPPAPLGTPAAPRQVGPPPPAPPFVAGAPPAVAKPPVASPVAPAAAPRQPAVEKPVAPPPAAPPVAPLDDARRPTQATPVVPVTPLN